MRLSRGAGIASAILAIALVASVTEWVLGLSARRTSAEPLVVLPASQLDARAGAVDVAPLARLFGAAPAGDIGGIRPLGVMAEGASGRGIALLALGEQRARPYRAGQTLAPGVVLKEVRKNSVVIERAGVPQELRIAPKSASTPPPAPIAR